MNIETLGVFYDLVKLQSFSRTGEKHGVSQSAISQQLAQLEIHHKCQLINRNKRPITPTAAGKVFCQGCEDIIERYDKLKSELNSLSQPKNRINIAAIFSIGMHTLQPYVTKFLARYPKIHLNIEYSTATDIYNRILKSEIDIGVVALPKEDDRLKIFPFENEPLVLVCSPEHPLANEPIVDIKSLQGQDFIAFDKAVPSRNLIDSILDRYNVTIHTNMEFDNIETIKRAVEIGEGISILPETTIHAELANGTLRSTHFTNEEFFRPTGIAIRKTKTLSQAGRYLLELLNQEPPPLKSRVKR